MDVRNQVQSQQAVRQPVSQPEVQANHHVGFRPTLAHKVLVALLIVASVLGIGLLANNVKSVAFAGSGINGGEYQALFLTNGQVYFGKLSDINGDYVKLTDIYYLQVQQSVQPSQSNNNSNGSQPQISLAKLGGELHGPEDEMMVARDQVLFWENLKNDGKVVSAIKQYQSQNKK